ncbi:hypothetical protein LCGC14_1154580 [marine sediment metagenome]|uniref:Helicase ATP-binding domain-containing protein n=1 Tax=marine sediment metagenome TaxID=412755 RepID=A0A0F9LUJ2_9ZZZZ
MKKDLSKYQEFLKSKVIQDNATGFKVNVEDLNPMLFDWQKVLVKWALYKGKSALFEDCGLGKTVQQLEWAKWVCKKTKGSILILAPLAVSLQTKREGRKFGIRVNVCKDQKDVKPGINISNYERLHKFDTSSFTGIVLDESGIIKNFAGKIRNQVIELFQNTQYKLCCTATPSPNDFTELGNTAEFLGTMTRTEMLSMFFINDTKDTGTWRLKGHVKDNLFWEWVCSWAVMMRKPSDIGFEDRKFILPPLEIHEHVVPYYGPNKGLLVREAKTLNDRRAARKESLLERVSIAAELANKNEDHWLMWCNLNVESELLKKSIGESVEVKGADTQEHKEISMLDFSENKIKCLVTKPRIGGFGMNWQNCNNMAFVGLSDSYEQYYQAVRRCWRFGQEKTVYAHIITEEREGAVVRNIKRKESDMMKMFDGMIKHMSELTKKELTHTSKTKTDYFPQIEMKLPTFIKAKKLKLKRRKK